MWEDWYRGHAKTLPYENHMELQTTNGLEWSHFFAFLLKKIFGDYFCVWWKVYMSSPSNLAKACKFGHNSLSVKQYRYRVSGPYRAFCNEALRLCTFLVVVWKGKSRTEGWINVGTDKRTDIRTKEAEPWRNAHARGQCTLRLTTHAHVSTNKPRAGRREVVLHQTTTVIGVLRPSYFLAISFSDCSKNRRAPPARVPWTHLAHN